MRNIDDKLGVVAREMGDMERKRVNDINGV